MAKYNLSISYDASCGCEVELPEGKNWDDIESWYVKWHTLHYWLKDDPETGHELELSEPDLDIIDFKRPAGVTVMSEDMQEEIDSDY